MDLYFKRHDGCAVTCDDFRSAMADANGTDLSAMESWYSQVRPQLLLHLLASQHWGWLGH